MVDPRRCKAWATTSAVVAQGDLRHAHGGARARTYPEGARARRRQASIDLGDFRDPAAVRRSRHGAEAELIYIPLLRLVHPQIPHDPGRARGRRLGACGDDRAREGSGRDGPADRHLSGRHAARRPDAPPDYKPGAAALYLKLGLPCVPVALNSGLYWPRRKFLRYPGTIIVEFLPPIPAGLPRREFDRRLIEAVETATARLEVGGGIGVQKVNDHLRYAMSSPDDMIADPIAREIWDMKYRFKRPDGAPVDQTIEDKLAARGEGRGRGRRSRRRAPAGPKDFTTSSRATASCPPGASCPAPAAAAR